MKCEICGRAPMFGENVSHSKRHTNRRFDTNVHAATLTIGGKTKHMQVCTRCLRNQNKVNK